MRYSKKLRCTYILYSIVFTYIVSYNNVKKNISLFFCIARLSKVIYLIFILIYTHMYVCTMYTSSSSRFFRKTRRLATAFVKFSLIDESFFVVCCTWVSEPLMLWIRNISRRIDRDRRQKILAQKAHTYAFKNIYVKNELYIHMCMYATYI